MAIDCLVADPDLCLAVDVVFPEREVGLYVASGICLASAFCIADYLGGYADPFVKGCHLGAIYGLLWIYFLVYSIIAVRRVYSRSSWGKAILKTFLLYGSYWIVWFTVFILSLVWISKNVLE